MRAISNYLSVSSLLDDRLHVTYHNLFLEGWRNLLFHSLSAHSTSLKSEVKGA